MGGTVATADVEVNRARGSRAPAGPAVVEIRTVRLSLGELERLEELRGAIRIGPHGLADDDQLIEARTDQVDPRPHDAVLLREVRLHLTSGMTGEGDVAL